MGCIGCAFFNLSMETIKYKLYRFSQVQKRSPPFLFCCCYCFFCWHLLICENTLIQVVKLKKLKRKEKKKEKNSRPR